MSDVLTAEGLDDLALTGLRYSSDTERGFARQRSGRGFTYRRADGSRVGETATLNRIRALAVPPAWTDVWICRTGNGHLQATGRDARSRKQYRYHESWIQMRGEAKFGELSSFGAVLPTIRRSVAADLARRGMPQEKVVALVIALMDRTLIRVGNEEYRRQNGTFGLTTLLTEHVIVSGATIRFSFTGKGGIDHHIRLTDRRIASAVRRCHELGGREVFTFLDEGQPRRVDSADCNNYLRAVAGTDTTVKTFRTWGGSVAALEHLAHQPGEPSSSIVLEAIDAAAKRLGNTRAVARRAYVHPAVGEAFLAGTLTELWSASRRTRSLSRPERALLRLLNG